MFERPWFRSVLTCLYDDPFSLERNEELDMQRCDDDDDWSSVKNALIFWLPCKPNEEEEAKQSSLYKWLFPKAGGWITACLYKALSLVVKKDEEKAILIHGQLYVRKGSSPTRGTTYEASHTPLTSICRSRRKTRFTYTLNSISLESQLFFDPSPLGVSDDEAEDEKRLWKEKERRMKEEGSPLPGGEKLCLARRTRFTN